MCAKCRVGNATACVFKTVTANVVIDGLILRASWSESTSLDEHESVPACVRGYRVGLLSYQLRCVYYYHLEKEVKDS